MIIPIKTVVVTHTHRYSKSRNIDKKKNLFQYPNIMN
jgi:hypothetical protein